MVRLLSAAALRHETRPPGDNLKSCARAEVERRIVTATAIAMAGPEPRCRHYVRSRLTRPQCKAGAQKLAGRGLVAASFFQLRPRDPERADRKTRDVWPA